MHVMCLADIRARSPAVATANFTSLVANLPLKKSQRAPISAWIAVRVERPLVSNDISKNITKNVPNTIHRERL